MLVRASGREIDNAASNIRLDNRARLQTRNFIFVVEEETSCLLEKEGSRGRLVIRLHVCFRQKRCRVKKHRKGFRFTLTIS